MGKQLLVPTVESSANNPRFVLTTIDGIVSAIRNGNDNTLLSALELLVCISDERTQRIANLAAPVLQNFCNKFLQYSNAETRRHG
jgi:hypothetical protein